MSMIFRFAWAIFVGGALSCAVARADPIDLSQFNDPSTLHFGPGANTACATGGCPIFIGGALDGEVNNISADRLDIYQNSGGAPALADPILLIFAVPDNSVALTGDTITAVSLYHSYPGSPTPVAFDFGTTAYGINASTGFAGLMSSGDIYSFLGIPNANNSNNFANLSAAELRMLGTNVTNFGIYVYSLNTGGFAGHDLLDVQLNGVQEGTFAVALGADPKGKHIYATPFTEAGLQDVPVVPVPEPPTILLFFSLLVGLAVLQGRSRFIARVRTY